MKFTIQYIPMRQIRADYTARKLTEPLKRLRRVLWDCTHLIAVRKDKHQNKYVVISGFSRYEYLLKTNQTFVPCLIDQEDGEAKQNIKAGLAHESIFRFIHHWRNRRIVQHYPQAKLERMEPASLSIFRRFLKEEPRFKQLSRMQQLKILYMGIRYRRTVIHCMRKKVEQLTR